MKKRKSLLTVGILAVVMLAGCAESQPEIPVSQEAVSPDEVDSEAEEFLHSHQEVMLKSERTVVMIDGKEAQVPTEAIVDLLEYDQWEEGKGLAEGMAVVVAVQDDELSFYENGTVRLNREMQSAWYEVPTEAYAAVKELYASFYLPTDEDYIFDEEWMWDTYFYETITSIGNAQSFSEDDLSEIDEIVEYVWYRYSNGYSNAEQMGFEPSPDLSGYYLFPREVAFEEASKYYSFDISKADLAQSYSYLPAFDAFQMHYVGPREAWEVSGNNPWAIYYGGAKPLADGRYEVRMIAYDDKEAGIIDRENVYTIRLSDAGTFLFEAGEIRMPVYPFSDFCEDLQPLESWTDQMDDYMRMIGENESELFFLESFDDVKLHRVQKADFTKVETMTFDWQEGERFEQMHQTQDHAKMIVCTSHFIRVYDENWEEEQAVALPGFLTEKILAETVWDEFSPETYFAGYDVTDDLSQIVFSDQEGLKTFALDIENPGIKLLETREEYPDDDLAPVSLYQSPRWVNQGQKIFMVRSGYEGNRGIALYDVKADKMNRYEHGWYSWPSEIQADQGLVIPNEYQYNPDTGEGVVQHGYLDFETGEVENFVFDRMGGGDMPDGSEFYHGENDLVLLAREYNEDSMGGMTTFVQVVDPNTWELLREVEIKAARVRISGMDRDGNIILHVFYNQASQGFGMIPAFAYEE